MATADAKHVAAQPARASGGSATATAGSAAAAATADPMEPESLLWNNLLLLGFDAAAQERRHRLVPAHLASASAPHRGAVLHRDMFAKPNVKCMQIVMHFLFDTIDSDQSAKRFAHAWPVHDAVQSREFNAAAIKWLAELEPNFVLRSASGIKKSHIEVASGARVVSLLWTFSTYALEVVIRRDAAAAAAASASAAASAVAATPAINSGGHSATAFNALDGWTPRVCIAANNKTPLKLLPHAIQSAQLHTVAAARAFVRHTERAVACQQLWAAHANELVAQRTQLQERTAAVARARAAFDAAVKPQHPDWFDDAAQVGAASTLRSQKVHAVARGYALLDSYYTKSDSGRALIGALVDTHATRPKVDGAHLKTLLGADPRTSAAPLDLNELVRRWNASFDAFDRELNAHFNPSDADLRFGLDALAAAPSEPPPPPFVQTFDATAKAMAQGLASNETAVGAMKRLNTSLIGSVDEVRAATTDLRALVRAMSAHNAAAPTTQRLKLVPPTPAAKFESYQSQPTPARTPFRSGSGAGGAGWGLNADQKAEAERITRSVARRVAPASPIAFPSLDEPAAGGGGSPPRSPLRFDDDAAAPDAVDPFAATTAPVPAAVAAAVAPSPKPRPASASATTSAARSNNGGTAARPASAARQPVGRGQPAAATGGRRAAAPAPALNNFVGGNGFAASNSSSSSSSSMNGAGSGGKPKRRGGMTQTTIRVPARAAAVASAAKTPAAPTPKLQQRLQFSPINEEQHAAVAVAASAARPAAPRSPPVPAVAKAMAAAAAAPTTTHVTADPFAELDAGAAVTRAYPPLQHTPIKPAAAGAAAAAAALAPATPGYHQSESDGGLTLSPTSLAD